MSKIFIFVVLYASSVSYAQAAKSPVFGEIMGLIGAEQIYASTARGNNLKKRHRDWIRLYVNRGDQVRKGQKIAEHRNIKGKVVLEYIANRSGRILLNSRSAIDSVESILEIITVAEDRYCDFDHCDRVGAY
ncbi:hypothetical protein [Microbulbifer sp. A4B17]|uniref:hypothetical protein n=1 Tax=Microbulbifer sp. A4B17 TaxID=359370 RepID=UPI001300934F|nr:hypothetical protein [Microbulbifer sp. A4B17]